jgi:hypothetical protein
MLPDEVVPLSRAARRSQTLRMLLMLVDLAADAKRIPNDLWPILAFDDRVENHDGLSQLDARHAWTGLVLRSQSVGAWRDLWSWLVGQLGVLTSTSLPSLTVGAGLGLAAAETDPSLDSLGEPGKYLALLFLGAARGATLNDHQAPYFEHPTEERGKQLTPTWLHDRIREWSDLPMRDFGVWLVKVLVDRSQWVAMRKARYERSTGTYKVPTRVFERDGMVFKDSNEGGGQIALRWSNAMSIMAGMGLVERDTKQAWTVTPTGAAARDRVPRAITAAVGSG